MCLLAVKIQLQLEIYWCNSDFLLLFTLFTQAYHLDFEVASKKIFYLKAVLLILMGIIAIYRDILNVSLTSARLSLIFFK